MSNEQALTRLVSVIQELLGENGCPWDKEQTPLSLCDYVVEEAFELVEGIRDNDPETACEELGDVMFLMLFIAELYERQNNFKLSDSLEYIAAKMIRRHPHVFGDLKLDGDSDQLLVNWEKIKRAEKKTSEDEHNACVFDTLPKGLPPMLRAYRINSKAARCGFTWASDEDQEQHLQDEWNELQQAVTANDKDAVEEEFGDYLFSLVEYGRRKGIKANAALDFANRKFLERFKAMEQLAREQGHDIADLDLDAQNALWDKVKK